MYYFSSTASAIALGDGNTVSVVTNTLYPFGEMVTFAVSNSKAFALRLRIPGWCKNATVSVTTGGSSGSSLRRERTLPSGSMASVSLEAGASTVVLTLPMEIRVVRRLPYLLSQNTSVDTNAANVYRGPLLYAIARDYTLAHDTPYDEAPSLLPIGQAHGQSNELLGTGDWKYALRISVRTLPLCFA